MYAYLKLKIPGPNGVITISVDFELAQKCDMACFALAEAYITAAELEEFRKMANLDGIMLSKKTKSDSAFKPN